MVCPNHNGADDNLDSQTSDSLDQTLGHGQSVGQRDHKCRHPDFRGSSDPGLKPGDGLEKELLGQTSEPNSPLCGEGKPPTPICNGVCKNLIIQPMSTLERLLLDMKKVNTQPGGPMLGQPRSRASSGFGENLLRTEPRGRA